MPQPSGQAPGEEKIHITLALIHPNTGRKALRETKKHRHERLSRREAQVMQASRRRAAD